MRKALNCLFVVAALALLCSQGCKHDDTNSTMHSGFGSPSMSDRPSGS